MTFSQEGLPVINRQEVLVPIQCKSESPFPIPTGMSYFRPVPIIFREKERLLEGKIHWLCSVDSRGMQSRRIRYELVEREEERDGELGASIHDQKTRTKCSRCPKSK
ncbi:hypothetical protein G7K_5905-t1 [Saitoella complicata NRRL Y-17804]|uniref:Uncharacterized protein n=1 Tax=Saitoella complicata (strain BCRC 22490 / CBS 7301 / JCM 7358 / NBRC 10748 / NRRL Y-17804) TaxID=698492 RepID=A0A0E9NPP6_SAICN|nr:hypothetical protein G7K_5905-t1 [Saitoella complicata NRRL Y-17804]